MVSYRADDRVVHAQFRDLADFLEPGDRAGDQHQRHAQRGACRRPAPMARRSNCISRPICPATSGWWRCACRAGAHRAVLRRARRAKRCACRAGRTATLHTPYRADRARAPAGPARLWIATLAAAGAAAAPISTRTASRSATATCKQRWPIQLLPDGLCHRAGQRRDALGGARLHAGADHAAGRARASRSRRCSCIPASPAWKITSRPMRSSTACRWRRRGWSTRRARAGRRVIAVGHHGGARAGNRDRRGRDDPPRRGLDATW